MGIIPCNGTLIAPRFCPTKRITILAHYPSYAHADKRKLTRLNLQIDADEGRYTETIPLLYAKTHFHFPGLTDILDFKKHVLPNRFDSIRVLSIDWEPNPFFIASTPQMRVDTWNTISQMKGLQQLRVYIKTLCILPDSSAARSLKQNLRKVTGLKKFQLIVTKDQFPIWNGFLDDDMEVKLTANTEARGDSSFRPMPATASLVRAY